MDKVPMGIGRIRELLPHRYPMLMLDRVIELSAAARAGGEADLGERAVLHRALSRTSRSSRAC